MFRTRTEHAAGVSAATSGAGMLDVFINDGFRTMVDGSLVYHRGFGGRPTPLTDPAPALVMGPAVFTADGRLVASRTYPLTAPAPLEGRPGPLVPDLDHPGHFLVWRGHWSSFFPDRTVIAETGSTIRLRVHNRLAQPHELSFHGAGTSGGDAGTGPMEPGVSVEFELPAPVPGTYLFSDPGNAGVERTLGLFGVLVVIDPRDAWRLGPGGAEFERQWLWICHDVVPEWARIASQGGVVDPGTAVPRYFTLNDRAGFESLAVTPDPGFNVARKEDTLISGFPRFTDIRDFSQSPAPEALRTGQLVRMVNAGVVGHQMHFHGNHVWTVRRNGTDFPRVDGTVDAEGHVALQQWEDTVELDPLDRKEVMLPFRRPPEVLDAVWEARDKDWKYPMHCHAEPSQTAAGGLYPGGLLADWVLAADVKSESHHAYRSQVDFASDQPQEGSPETELPQSPDVRMEFDFFNTKLEFPDGSEHDVWGFETDGSGRGLPAPVLRLKEGQTFHGTIKPSKKVHTIHWHGIEPDPRNDGVGHTSFEVTGHYTYQWQAETGVAGDPHRGTAGTYFYHCHVNTPLHLQMGMFGPIIVDPQEVSGAPATLGARRHSVDGPEYDIDTETLVMPFSIDPRWHELNHAAGLSGEDVGLNRYEPQHSFLFGGELARRPKGDMVWALTGIRANTAESGRMPTLVRMINADFFPTRTRFTDMDGRPVRMADLIAHDGRIFRHTSSTTGPAAPAWSTGSPLLTSIIASGAAEKFDFLLRPPAPGQYLMTITWEHWITRKILATRSTAITAT